MSALPGPRPSAPVAPPATRLNALMGVINVTPDSFSDAPGQLTHRLRDPQAVAACAAEMAAAGAGVVDIGGEATSFHRPGIAPVAADQQIARVVPAIRAIAAAGLKTTDNQPLQISIDTRSSAVARAAHDAGATMINDVSAGTADPAMLPAAAALGCPIVLMHAWFERPAEGYPDNPAILEVVREYLAQRAQAAIEAGVRPDALYLDPGIGFGKSPHDNWRLLGNLKAFSHLGFPLVVGISRKRFLLHNHNDARAPAAAGTDNGLRDALTAAVTARLHDAGVALHRVHNVAWCHKALAACELLARASG